MSVDITTAKCAICRLGHTDEFAHGEWKTDGEHTVHYFCLLLSKGLPQSGESQDEDGILGFLSKDIKDYSKTRKKTKCLFCKKPYASIHCSVKKCHKWWHVSCGYEGKCLPIFKDSFKSICAKHIDITEQYEIHGSHWSCQMCNELMGDYHPITSIPSCCRQGYFHRTCMQKFANTAGLVAKCPACGQKDGNYRDFLSQRGIFCPEKDADWELVENAFGSQLRKNIVCKADQCICPMGRLYTGKSTEWRWKLCRFCGGSGIHVGCFDDDEDVFECEDCIIESQTQPPPEPFVNAYAENEADASDINTEIEEEGETNDNDNHEVDRMDTESEIDNDSDELEDVNNGFMLVETKLAQFRTHSLVVVKPDQVTHADPNSVEEQMKMRQTRLKMFFKKADFSEKPEPLPWLL